MKKILFLLFSFVVVAVFIARQQMAQTSETTTTTTGPMPINPPLTTGVHSVDSPRAVYPPRSVDSPRPVSATRFRIFPSVQIKPELPLTEPIRIEIGSEIATSVEIKRVSGAEIKIVAPAATQILTSSSEARALPADSP
jgi:hypothetical protein